MAKDWKRPSVDLVEAPDPFGELSVEERRVLVLEAARKQQKIYESLKTGIDEQLLKCDPLHVVCVTGLSLVVGAGLETMSVGQHDAELLQALFLRNELPKYGSIVGRPQHVDDAHKTVQEFFNSKNIVDLGAADFSNAAENRDQILSSIRHYTKYIRGDLYPYQVRKIINNIADKIDSKFEKENGISSSLFFSFLFYICEEIEERLNQHIDKVRNFYKAATVQDLLESYGAVFPNVSLEHMEEFSEENHLTVDDLKKLLLSHSELFLPEIFTISKTDIHQFISASGEDLDASPILRLLDKVALKFGDTRGANIDHLMLDNPVWEKPVIKLDSDYILPLPTLIYHYANEIFLSLCATSGLQAEFEAARADVLEAWVVGIFKNRFPPECVHTGVQWRLPGKPDVYENDVVIVFGRCLVIAEVKAGHVTAPARRGAYDRLRREIRKIMSDAEEQSRRLKEHLTSLTGVHTFKGKEGDFTIDCSAIEEIVRVNVSYENIGFLNSNAMQLKKAGLISDEYVPIPNLSASFLEVLFDVLPKAYFIVHYFERRRLFEENANYEADELDLITFYLDTGFNIGDTEVDGQNLILLGYSNALDTRLVHGPVGTQECACSKWWQRHLDYLEASDDPFWLSKAMRLLDVSRKDQQVLERKLKKEMKAKKSNCDVIEIESGPKLRRHVVLFLIVRDVKKIDQLKKLVDEKIFELASRRIESFLFVRFDKPKFWQPSCVEILPTSHPPRPDLWG